MICILMEMMTKKIFKDAYLFFFADDDFEGVSKPFKYYKGMKL